MRIEDMVQKTICYSGLEDISKDCQIEKINLAKVVGGVCKGNMQIFIISR